MNDERGFCYLFQARSTEIIIYYEFEPNRMGSPERKQKSLDSMKKVETYSGDITTHARRRLKKAIEFLYMTTPQRKVFNRVLMKETNFKLSHLTLTISAYQNLVSDSEIVKNCLSPFLRDCIRKLGMSNYVWKAERQENGNLHFHIISDMFNEIQKIRNLWNRYQNYYGFTDSFQEKYTHADPNSIDIHYVKRDNQLAAYLAKYLQKTNAKKCKSKKKVTYIQFKDFYNDKATIEQTKELNKRRKGVTTCKVWDSSKSLKSSKYIPVDLSTRDRDALFTKFNEIGIAKYDGDYFSIMKFNDTRYIHSMPEDLQLAWSQQYRTFNQQNKNCNKLNR